MFSRFAVQAGQAVKPRRVDNVNLSRTAIRAFGNAPRHHFPQWDTGVAYQPTKFQWNNCFTMTDSEFYAPASSTRNTLYRKEFHQLQDNRDLEGGKLDANTHEKRPVVSHSLDLDWSLAGDPHNRIGIQSQSQYCHYCWVREPTFPRTPDLAAGELATGAMSYRTEVWKTKDEPAIVSVARFTPDHFRAYDYEFNAPVPATCAPDAHLDFRQNRLPLGHADRRPWIYFASAVTCAVSLSMVRSFAVKVVYMLWPGTDQFAAGVIEVDLKQVRIGQTLTVKFRGKPVFITRRTQDWIDQAKADDAFLPSMRDPELDSERAIKAEYLISLGVCTHLGCIPYPDQGDYHGYFCPCHGSHYDTSGRIRRGPAPKNMEVPPYMYLDDYTVKIG